MRDTTKNAENTIIVPVSSHASTNPEVDVPILSRQASTPTQPMMQHVVRVLMVFSQAHSCVAWAQATLTMETSMPTSSGDCNIKTILQPCGFQTGSKLCCLLSANGLPPMSATNSKHYGDHSKRTGTLPQRHQSNKTGAERSIQDPSITQSWCGAGLSHAPKGSVQSLESPKMSIRCARPYSRWSVVPI